MEIRKRIDVSGIVQGVGFRPYVYRLATSRNLTGSILNTPAGVTIEIQGSAEQIENFLSALPAEAPPLSKITDVLVQDLPCNGDRDFRIVHSRSDRHVSTLISPDVAVCGDCLRELFDPADRRYRYPFINCTNCGPRFTIVRDIPYDRPGTSMAVFPMCPECQAEYEDPLDRRFHAQPNACWKCGPQVELRDSRGELIGCSDAIAEAAACLERGEIVAIKGLGGFHLAADATNAVAVTRLRERKRRVEKPFAVMVPDLAAARGLCEVDQSAQAVLLSIQRPIVLLPWRRPSVVVDEVAPRNRYLGVFLPYAPVHHLLLAAGRFKALVMTSGNLSEEPIAIGNEEALARLGSLADYFLLHNRDILLRCDDSVLRTDRGSVRHMRRSRGFVPVPVFLKEEQPSVLAVGGELKNTICLTKGKHAFLSQHIGDLENIESFQFFNEAIDHLEKILEIQPEIIAHDLHPGYFSTRWALQQTATKLVGVQHHHAHIASCMAENQLDGQVIGIALDGTGYGTDGKIWGGEVLLASYTGFERAAHLEYVPLPGGEAAIREPWRMAVSYLYKHFGRDFLKMRFPFVSSLDGGKTEILLRMIEQNVNSPLTSSCGRLFDAVAALIGLRLQVNYEAQAAIELEMAMARRAETESATDPACYPLKLSSDGESAPIGTRPLFEGLIRDLVTGKSAATISWRFHNALVEVFGQVAFQIREQTGLDRICLSGGSFNNLYLSSQLEQRLAQCGFRVFTQREIPAGDGGLSLGQAMIAARNFH